MNQETFTAGVQYDDYKGTVAADNADMKTLRDHLVKSGHIQSGDFLIGVEIYKGGMSDDPIIVYAITTKSTGPDNLADAIDSGKPLPVRKISMEMSADEFFSFFKRFNICMSSGHGMLDGVEIQFDE